MTRNDTQVKFPGTAVVFSALTGFFFLLFGLNGILTGLSRRPVDWPETYGGVREAVVVGLGLIVIALIHWGRPKAGSIFMILVGIAFGIWIIGDWTIPARMGSWLERILLSVIPVILGTATFFTEIAREKRSRNSAEVRHV